MTITTDIEGLQGVAEYFRRMPDITAQASSLAINRTINRGGLTIVKTEMYDQINFPKSYLSGDRLRVSKLATPKDLVGAILGRHRATSLARFAAPGTPIGGKGGVKVVVKKGKTTYMKNAWLVRLRKGASLTDDQYNIGLAVRLAPGESLNKRSAHQAWLIKPTVALLYGPSVDQVFKDVADTTAPRVLSLLSTEFFRQFERLS